MSTAFATLESDLSAACLGAFENIRLLRSGVGFGATIDRGVSAFGEGNFTSEARDRITLARAATSGWANGDVITADPAHYSVGELAALPRTSWKLDRLDVDDGIVVSWWLK